MSEKNHILIFGKPKGTVEIQSHPDDILDVSPEILAVMNARLKGETLGDVYDKSDSVTDGFLLHKEVQKLRNIFSNGRDVYEGFSSLTAIKETRRLLAAEEVDRALLASYALKKLSGEFSDEADVYAALVEDKSWVSKKTRVDSFSERENFVFQLLVAFYLGSHFDCLGVSKEMIELQPTLQNSFRAGKIADEMNALLRAFYLQANT